MSSARVQFDLSGTLPEVPIRSSRVLDLNVLRARLRFNTKDSEAYSYFASFAPDDSTADFDFTCVDLDHDELDESVLSRLSDRTIRSKRFRSGYYRGAYFGAPAYLVTRGREWHVYGRTLEKIVWPYLLKQALNVFALDAGYAHLKAAAFAHPDGGVTLLVGAKGSGKSVFLTRACQGGARFVTNTHALLRDGVVHGIPSALRVRDDECFGDLIRERGLRGHLVDGEYLATPDVLFGDAAVLSGPVRNVVLMNYLDGHPARFERVPSDTALSFLEQFALALNVYDLRYDLLEHLDRDVDRYVAAYGAMRDELATLCGRAKCYVANVGMQDPAVRRSVLAELAVSDVR
ncbi:MAG: FomB family phosphonate monophosphate kinase [Actinophytocola sp.]|uniref:FomB family phosphonate monophosphate kinase n=1 Tax=Actinophytocola sp. TaxID=1872138 RepID=UPI003C768C41